MPRQVFHINIKPSYYYRPFDFLQEKHHRRISVAESYTLTGLYPNTLYYVWLAARSQRGEGATTPPIPVRTKQYGKEKTIHVTYLN